jgi:hypothetical protein
MSLMGRLRVLPLPITLPKTCRSRWPAEQLTFAKTRSRPGAVLRDRLLSDLLSPVPVSAVGIP